MIKIAAVGTLVCLAFVLGFHTGNTVGKVNEQQWPSIKNFTEESIYSTGWLGSIDFERFQLREYVRMNRNSRWAQCFPKWLRDDMDVMPDVAVPYAKMLESGGWAPTTQ
jgi:hypothetical protein